METSAIWTQIIRMAPDPDTPKQRQYGQVFVISKKWEKHYWGARKISERISVAQFRLNKTGQRKTTLCIINVYGAHGKGTRSESGKKFTSFLSHA